MGAGNFRWKSEGFTLIELLVVVAIVGVLGSVSITAFGFYVDRSKLSETSSLLDDLVKREVGHFQTPRYSSSGATLNPCYLAFPAAPSTLGLTKRAFVDPSGNAASIGFAPTGQIYSSFGVFGSRGTAGICHVPDEAPTVTLANQWYVRANGYANLDGDSEVTILSFLGIDSAYARTGFSGSPCDLLSSGGYSTTSYFTRWLGTGELGVPRIGNMFVAQCSS